MSRGQRRLLIAVSPRVLSDALRALIDQRGAWEVVQLEPGIPARGRFDVALVSEPAPVDADVVIELLDSGMCVVLHHVDGDRVIELCDASALVDVVAGHLGVAGFSILDR